MPVRKALVISLRDGADLGDLVQIARAEGRKLFHGQSVKVDEVFKTALLREWVVVVQGSEVVSESKMTVK